MLGDIFSKKVKVLEGRERGGEGEEERERGYWLEVIVLLLTRSLSEGQMVSPLYPSHLLT